MGATFSGVIILLLRHLLKKMEDNNMAASLDPFSVLTDESV
jgi:hypothetical protein